MYKIPYVFKILAIKIFYIHSTISVFGVEHYVTSPFGANSVTSKMAHDNIENIIELLVEKKKGEAIYKVHELEPERFLTM